MKILAKLVLLGIILFPMYFFWSRGSRSAPQSVTGSILNASPDSSAPAPITIPAHKPGDSLAHTKALLRWKLKLWQESLNDNPDDEASRDQLMHEMLALVTDDNVAAIVQALSPSSLNTPFGIAALHHWMQVEPLSATDWLAGQSRTTSGETLAIADDWLGYRAGLQACLDQLPATDWKQNFIIALSAELSARDPAAAVQLAQQLNPGPAQLNLLQTVVCNWAGTNPTAALNWVTGIKDPAMQEELIISATQSYALTDPGQAATWLVSAVDPDARMNTAALNILKIWSAQDPAQAAEWVSTFPDGGTKTAAVQIVAGYWQHANRDAAEVWLQSLAGSPATQAN